MKTAGLPVALLVAGLLHAPCAWSAEPEQAAAPPAAGVAALTQQAARAKNPDEAVALLKQAMGLAPEEPGVHMNYASVLFKTGQAILATGKKEDGRVVFREVEKELLAALRLAKNEPDPVHRAQLRSQSNFLLGDITMYVFTNKEKAKSYYQEALWYDPQHPGALEARQRYGESLERKAQ